MCEVTNLACPLCEIPLRETLLYEDDSIYLVVTKNMKGHTVRMMACIKEHRKEPNFVERTKIYIILYLYMHAKLSEEWVFLEGLYASCKDHFHIVASDLKGTPEELEALAKTPKVIVPFW